MNKQDYLIYCDVSADIDSGSEAAGELNYIPMNYTLGEALCECTGREDDALLHRFYDGQRSGDLTRTSQITPFQYVELMEPVLRDGHSVLYLSLSSGLSSTYQSACLAQQTLAERVPEQVFLPVDTLAATGGMGVLAERALRNRANGMSVQENYEDIREAAHHIRHWFLVQDLMYLKRGGRIGAATAAVGTLLNMKPILKIDEAGKLVNIARERGNKAACRSLLARFAETYAPEAGDVIYVIDADDAELSSLLCERIRSLYPEATVRTSRLSPIIGAHTGPGMAAICHMGK